MRYGGKSSNKGVESETQIESSVPLVRNDGVRGELKKGTVAELFKNNDVRLSMSTRQMKSCGRNGYRLILQ